MTGRGNPARNGRERLTSGDGSRPQSRPRRRGAIPRLPRRAGSGTPYILATPQSLAAFATAAATALQTRGSNGRGMM